MGNKLVICELIIKNHTTVDIQVIYAVPSAIEFPDAKRNLDQLKNRYILPYESKKIELYCICNIHKSTIKLTIQYLHGGSKSISNFWPKTVTIPLHKVKDGYSHVNKNFLSSHEIVLAVDNTNKEKQIVTVTVVDQDVSAHVRKAEDCVKSQDYDYANKIYRYLENKYIDSKTPIPSDIKKKMLRVFGAIEAIKLNKKGEVLMKEKKYEAALEKFFEAERQTKEKPIRDIIKKNRLLVYGFLNLNPTIEEIFNQVEHALKNELYDEAMRLLDESWHLADSPSLLERFQLKKSMILATKGKALFENGFTLEAKTTKEAPEQALSKFEEAKKCIQEAQELIALPEHENMLKLVELKIKANLRFKEALEMEISALEMFQDSMNIDVWSKHENALTKYEEVKKKFEIGAKENDRFKANIELVQKVLNNGRKLSQEMAKVLLHQDIVNLEMEDDWEEETEDEEEIDEGKIMGGI